MPLRRQIPLNTKGNKTELKQMKSLNSQIQTIRFKYGNTHRKATNPEKCRQTGYLKKHKWSAYVRSLDQNLTDRSCIDSVTFKLDKNSFGKEQIMVKRAPFKFTSTGWGTFEIPMIIHWKAWMKKAPTVIRHELSFEGKGKANFLSLQVDTKSAKPHIHNL